MLYIIYIIQIRLYCFFHDIIVTEKLKKTQNKSTDYRINGCEIFSQNNIVFCEYYENQNEKKNKQIKQTENNNKNVGVQPLLIFEFFLRYILRRFSSLARRMLVNGA